ncbi:peptidoglycan DD-metalloendopeptidase family protein [uncultured Xylophilus sp.]|uniref:peptidoglycan DD-metalloendopeptidase family protein n=1 Tax=uncultured Xylophilus sp. TaxID=296832 RepID=UPI0025FFA3D4|nr:peptidoglycan DD-metalloendopeptidase family protein [uncultured Xylophilus sp.]
MWIGTGALAAATAMLAGCNTAPDTPRRAPPVEDRGIGAGSFPPPSTATPPFAPPVRLPGAENAGKPGYYTVKPGDTVRRIGQETGQNWRDIIRWNELANPDLIEVGQVLRVAPPSAQVAQTAPAKPTDPAAPSTVTPTPLPPATPASTVRPMPSGGGGEEEIAFIWPASGVLIASFDEAKNKGYDIGGKAGDPVVAAADGRVVYAGAGLRGYGNLVILKHNNTYLTAYAHNQSLLVKEDQTVKKGQKIAEMGSSDADRVKLHFEIRRQGKPVDPSRYLAAR